MKRIFTSILVFFMLSSIFPIAIANGGEMKFEGDGYTSPEAAVEAYLEFMNDGNVNGMISTFAIETYVDNYNTVAYLKNMHCASKSMYMGIPSSSSYSRDLLINQRHGKISQTLFDQYLYYSCRGTNYEALAESATFALRTEEDINTFISCFDNSAVTKWIEGTISGNIIDTERYLYEHYGERSIEQYSRGIENRLKYYSCNEYEDVMCIIDLGGEDYMLIMGCAQYGDRWYIVDIGGIAGVILGFTTYEGGLVPLSNM